MGEGPPHTTSKWDIAAVALLALLSAAILATFAGYGTTWDEAYHLDYGDAILAWYGSWFQDRRALDFLDLYLYGGLFDAPTQLLARALPLGVYEARHLVNAVAGLVGVVATWRIGTIVGGKAAGFASAAMLALTPTYYGHAFANPKDIPFASLTAVALWAALASARQVPRIPWPSVVAAGAASGAAMGVRVGGIALLGWLGLAWVGHVAVRGPQSRWREAIPALAARFAVAAAVAWIGMLVFWPWAQLAPFTRPFVALRAASHFQTVNPVLFDGRIVASNALPWTYLPTWFAVTLPEAYLVAAITAGYVAVRVLAGRQERPPPEALVDVLVLAVAVVALPVAAIGLHANIYDAQRHFLFVLPPLAALSGTALAWFARGGAPMAARALIVVAVVAASALTALDAVRLHPYEYVYFNRLIGGGLRGAATRFETDYWGASYREGAEWLLREYPVSPGRATTVANCSLPFLTGYWLARTPEGRARFRTVLPSSNPDIFVTTTRYGCASGVPGRVIHTVERDGVPLLYVFELRRPQ
ncbi:MAG TPA: glycosyltransferase family 39 protein [Anaeromyxobacteraceae bacterium]|nr:glycosyltransferase family 39 protein [Anaeromyxobacteraceae bacterium]